MKHMTRGLLIAAALLVPAWAPVAAQQSTAGNYGWGVSYMNFAPFVEGDSAVIADDLQLDPGLGFTLHAEHWFGWARFFGLQLELMTTLRPLDYFTDSQDARVTSVAGRGMVRFVGGRPKVIPFVGVGGGLTWFDLGDGPERIPGSEVLWTSESRQWTGLAGAGLDIFPGETWLWPEVGIRLEVIDHVTFGRPFDLVEGDNDDIAHNLRFGVSLQASPLQ